MVPLVLELLFFGCLGSEDHFEGITTSWGGLLIVLEHLLEAVEVETIPDVVLVYPAEVSVVLEVAEPADPTVVFL